MEVLTSLRFKNWTIWILQGLKHGHAFQEILYLEENLIRPRGRKIQGRFLEDSLDNFSGGLLLQDQFYRSVGDLLLLDQIVLIVEVFQLGTS